MPRKSIKDVLIRFKECQSCGAKLTEGTDEYKKGRCSNC